MKDVPYWIDTAPDFPDRSGRTLPHDVDVAIVGGGITGLNAAIALARKGASAVVLEQDRFGSGASGRNGGMCTTGVSVGPATAVKRYGLAAARAYHDAYRDAVDFVESLVRAEGIDCDFRRAGRLGVAYRPSHHEHQRATQKLLAERFGHETILISPAELRAELGSPYYHGGLLDPLSAGLHPAKYVRGLAETAERSGARLHEKTKVTSVQRGPSSRFRIGTPLGWLSAGQVLLATDAYTTGIFRKLQRRMVVVGSFIVVTEPLDDGLAREIIPRGRMVVDTKNIGHYFRLTPDGRLLFGGRARFALSNPGSDRKSAAVLHRDMLNVFPQLAGTRIDYVWGGHVGFPVDRMPHAGQIGGLYYSMGYSGHGVQMASLMGARMAEIMDGHPEANPWRDLKARAFPTYGGTAWFLPFVGAYYGLRDRLA
ncbi:MAG TPA: FAD-binding oxidoreductase [bacterium]|nr:FAD-binding oxidoreductase [bacterium]